MNSHYNRNYTKEQATVILQKIHDCLRENRYTIAQNENRKENIDLINEYNLTNKKQWEILLQIAPEDYCYSVNNTKLHFEYEVLYVFCPQVKLYNFDGVEEMVNIYTKFNVIDMPNGNRVVVISFHKLNKPIDYLFR